MRNEASRLPHRSQGLRRDQRKRLPCLILAPESVPCLPRSRGILAQHAAREIERAHDEVAGRFPVRRVAHAHAQHDQIRIVLAGGKENLLHRRPERIDRRAVAVDARGAAHRNVDLLGGIRVGEIDVGIRR